MSYKVYLKLEKGAKEVSKREERGKYRESIWGETERDLKLYILKLSSRGSYETKFIKSIMNSMHILQNNSSGPLKNNITKPARPKSTHKQKKKRRWQPDMKSKQFQRAKRHFRTFETSRWLGTLISGLLMSLILSIAISSVMMSNVKPNDVKIPSNSTSPTKVDTSKSNNSTSKLTKRTGSPSEGDLLVQLLHKTGTIDEANQLLDRLIVATGTEQQQLSSLVGPDYSAVKATLANPPIRVILPPEKSQHLHNNKPSGLGLLDELLEATAGVSRITEANKNVHYDEDISPAISGQLARASGLLPLNQQQATDLLHASKLIENIMAPPKPPKQEQNADHHSTFAGNIKSEPMKASSSNRYSVSHDDERLNNNESVTSLMIRSPNTNKLIANYSHWINHEQSKPSSGIKNLSIKPTNQLVTEQKYKDSDKFTQKQYERLKPADLPRNTNDTFRSTSDRGQTKVSITPRVPEVHQVRMLPSTTVKPTTATHEIPSPTRSLVQISSISPKIFRASTDTMQIYIKKSLPNPSGKPKRSGRKRKTFDDSSVSSNYSTAVKGHQETKQNVSSKSSSNVRSNLINSMPEFVANRTRNLDSVINITSIQDDILKLPVPQVKIYNTVSQMMPSTQIETQTQATSISIPVKSEILAASHLITGSNGTNMASTNQTLDELPKKRKSKVSLRNSKRGKKSKKSTNRKSSGTSNTLAKSRRTKTKVRMNLANRADASSSTVTLEAASSSPFAVVRSPKTLSFVQNFLGSTSAISNWSPSPLVARTTPALNWKSTETRIASDIVDQPITIESTTSKIPTTFEPLTTPIVPKMQASTNARPQKTKTKTQYNRPTQGSTVSTIIEPTFPTIVNPQSALPIESNSRGEDINENTETNSWLLPTTLIETHSSTETPTTEVKFLETNPPTTQSQYSLVNTESIEIESSSESISPQTSQTVNLKDRPNQEFGSTGKNLFGRRLMNKSYNSVDSDQKVNNLMVHQDRGSMFRNHNNILDQISQKHSNPRFGWTPTLNQSHSRVMDEAISVRPVEWQTTSIMSDIETSTNTIPPSKEFQTEPSGYWTSIDEGNEMNKTSPASVSASEILTSPELETTTQTKDLNNAWDMEVTTPADTQLVAYPFDSVLVGSTISPEYSPVKALENQSKESNVPKLNGLTTRIPRVRSTPSETYTSTESTTERIDSPKLIVPTIFSHNRLSSSLFKYRLANRTQSLSTKRPTLSSNLLTSDRYSNENQVQGSSSTPISKLFSNNSVDYESSTSASSDRDDSTETAIKRLVEQNGGKTLLRLSNQTSINIKERRHQSQEVGQNNVDLLGLKFRYLANGHSDNTRVSQRGQQQHQQKPNQQQQQQQPIRTTLIEKEIPIEVSGQQVESDNAGQSPLNSNKINNNGSRWRMRKQTENSRESLNTESGDSERRRREETSQARLSQRNLSKKEPHNESNIVSLQNTLNNGSIGNASSGTNLVSFPNQNIAEIVKGLEMKKSTTSSSNEIYTKSSYVDEDGPFMSNRQQQQQEQQNIIQKASTEANSTTQWQPTESISLNEGIRSSGPTNLPETVTPTSPKDSLEWIVNRLSSGQKSRLHSTETSIPVDVQRNRDFTTYSSGSTSEPETEPPITVNEVTGVDSSNNTATHSFPHKTMIFSNLFARLPAHLSQRQKDPVNENTVSSSPKSNDRELRGGKPETIGDFSEVSLKPELTTPEPGRNRTKPTVQLPNLLDNFKTKSILKTFMNFGSPTTTYSSPTGTDFHKKNSSSKIDEASGKPNRAQPETDLLFGSSDSFSRKNYNKDTTTDKVSANKIHSNDNQSIEAQNNHLSLNDLSSMEPNTEMSSTVEVHQLPGSSSTTAFESTTRLPMESLNDSSTDIDFDINLLQPYRPPLNQQPTVSSVMLDTFKQTKRNQFTRNQRHSFGSEPKNEIDNRGSESSKGEASGPKSSSDSKSSFITSQRAAMLAGFTCFGLVLLSLIILITSTKCCRGKKSIKQDYINYGIANRQMHDPRLAMKRPNVLKRLEEDQQVEAHKRWATKLENVNKGRPIRSEKKNKSVTNSKDIFRPSNDCVASDKQLFSSTDSNESISVTTSSDGMTYIRNLDDKVTRRQARNFDEQVRSPTRHNKRSRPKSNKGNNRAREPQAESQSRHTNEDSMAWRSTLRQKLSGTMTSRLIQMHLPRLLPFLALDYARQQRSENQAPIGDVNYGFEYPTIDDDSKGENIFSVQNHNGQGKSATRPSSSRMNPQQSECRQNISRPKIPPSQPTRQAVLKPKHLSASSSGYQYSGCPQNSVHNQTTNHRQGYVAPTYRSVSKHNQPPTPNNLSSQYSSGRVSRKLPFGTASSVLRQSVNEPMNEPANFLNLAHQQINNSTNQGYQCANQMRCSVKSSYYDRSRCDQVDDTVSVQHSQMDNEHHLLIDNLNQPIETNRNLDTSQNIKPYYQRSQPFSQIVYDENDENQTIEPDQFSKVEANSDGDSDNYYKLEPNYIRHHAHDKRQSTDSNCNCNLVMYPL